MLRSIVLLVALFLLSTCSPKFTGTTNPASLTTTTNPSTPDVGRSLLNRIQLLQNINVLGSNEQARVQVLLPDGSFSTVRPVFTLNGVQYSNDFARVYKAVVEAGKTIMSVTKANGGLPAQNANAPVTIVIETMR